MKKIYFFLFLLFCSSSLIFAGTVTHNILIPQPRIEEIDGYHYVALDKAMITGEVGDPQLPVWGLNLLLPPGEEAISVSVELGKGVSLGRNYRIPPVQKQYPLSFKGPAQPDAPNPKVYEKNAAFPADPVAHFHTDFYRGHGIVAIALNPVTYNPVSGEVVYYPNLTVTVNSASSTRASKSFAQMLRQDIATINELTSQIDNPTEVTLYGAIENNTDVPYYDILLITHQNMVDIWDDYIDWKTKCGYYVVVETVQNIYATYPGVDNPEKIRNCIIDYYQNWDLSYVFLAGDDEICPHRGLYNSSGYTDDDIAGDCYFAGLDGTWDDNNNGLWGEPQEADLRMEVGVSRGAVDSEEEINNFVNKQMMYMRTPVVEEVETSLMVGEDLGWPIWAWEYKEEVRTGNSSWGFFTAPFPPNFEVRTLYDTPGNIWSGMNDLRPLMNQGPIYINHLGHADVDYMMKLYDNQITPANFTNNGINHNFYLVYSQGCYCGSFDNRTTGGSYVSDCITEIFSTISTAAVVMVTNSRYGWGNLTTTQGSSQYYDKQFFDAIWGEAITIASKTNEDSKEDCIPYIDYEQNRWCYYEINIFCEPTLDLWTAEPQVLAPNYAAEIFLGANSFQVTVPGVDSARVCLSKDGVIHAIGFTNSSGVCNLIITEPLLSLGPADLYVTAHDYLPHEGTVLVIPPTGAYVIYDSLSVDDQQGNNNGVWDYGETTYIDMTVENVGVAGADNVNTTISSTDSLVTILDGTANFGNIAQGATAFVDNAYTVMVEGAVEDGYWIPFTLTATSDTSTWTSYFNIQVSAPDIVFSELEIDDSLGNGNGNLDPGETAVLNITIQNEGGCYTTLLVTVLSSSDPYITINTGTVAYGTIPSGGEATGAFNITVSPSCPQEHTVIFNLNFTDAVGYSGTDEFNTVVGDITYLPTGPDGYGYSAYDPNDLPEMPVYQWVEISADSGGPGTMIPFVNDDQAFQFALPFPFQFYGVDYDTFSIGANGWLAMGIVTEDDYSNSGIPNTDGPAAMIGTYWEDLSPQRPNSGKVWQWYDTSNHCFIVEYNHIEQYAPVGNFETFETILYDPVYYPTITNDGRIKMQYKEMSTASQTEGTVGIENQTETIGIQYFFDGTTDVHAMPVTGGMCILYTTETVIPPLDVTLTPQNPPIIIPPEGGSFQYLAQVADTGSVPVQFDVWIMVTLPNGQPYGPVFQRMGLSLNPGGSLSRNMTQPVPGAAPAGQYFYIMYGGDYNNGAIYSQDSFEFTKSGVDGSGGNNSWLTTGWEGEETMVVLEAYALFQNYPNPFNPTTTIHYALPEASKVRLAVYNTLGQEVALLYEGWESAGYKSVELNATGWSSGVYFYRLEAGNFSEMKKMVIIK